MGRRPRFAEDDLPIGRWLGAERWDGRNCPVVLHRWEGHEYRTQAELSVPRAKMRARLAYGRWRTGSPSRDPRKASTLRSHHGEGVSAQLPDAGLRSTRCRIFRHVGEVRPAENSYCEYAGRASPGGNVEFKTV